MARILVVDDDVEQVWLRKQVLESGGHNVDVALCAADTVQKIAQGNADLLITDLVLPNAVGMPDPRVGLAMIRCIRERGWALPVIVLSGWPDALYGEPEEAMVSCILCKPVAVAILLETIRRLLG